MRMIRTAVLLLMLAGVAACNHATVSTNLACAGGSSSGTTCAVGANVSLSNRLAEDPKQVAGVDLAMFIAGGAFDAANIVYDLSDSTTQVLANSGYATVTATLSNNKTKATSFAWTRVDQTLVPDSPSAINTWLSSFDAAATEITVNLGNVTVENYAGTNVVTGKITYGSVVQAGDADAWYNDCSGYCVVR